MDLVKFFKQNGFINIFSDNDLSKNPKEGILWFRKANNG